MATEWINSHTTFVSLVVSDNVSAVRQPEIDQIRATLSASGWKSIQYLNERIVSIVKLLDDLEATGSIQHIFYCTANNYRLTKVTSQRLKAADPSIKIVWFGPLLSESQTRSLATGGADICIGENPEEDIPRLLIYGTESLVAESARNSEIASACSRPRERGKPRHEMAPPPSLPDQINGLESFYSGLYPPRTAHGLVDHISVPSGLETLNNLQKLCSITAAVILQPSAQPENDYHDFTTRAMTQNYYYHRLYQVAPRNETMKNGADGINPPLTTPVLPYAKAELSNSYCFLEISEQDDLQAFLGNAQYFHLTGSLRHNYELNGVITDACRWLGHGHCFAQFLPRLYVDGSSRLFPCQHWQTSIGTSGDSLSTLKTKVKTCLEDITVQRNCSGCPAREYCSKCAFLQPFLSPPQYCTIVQQRPYLASYLYSLMVVRILQKRNSLFRDITAKTLKMVTSCTNHFTPNDVEGNGLSRIQQFVYLFILAQGPVLFDASTNRTIRISLPLATIFEALVKGLDAHSIVMLLIERYELQNSEAAELLRQTLSGFTRENLLLEGHGDHPTDYLGGQANE